MALSMQEKSTLRPMPNTDRDRSHLLIGASAGPERAAGVLSSYPDRRSSHGRRRWRGRASGAGGRCPERDRRRTRPGLRGLSGPRSAGRSCTALGASVPGPGSGWPALRRGEGRGGPRVPRALSGVGRRCRRPVRTGRCATHRLPPVPPRCRGARPARPATSAPPAVRPGSAAPHVRGRRRAAVRRTHVRLRRPAAGLAGALSRVLSTRAEAHTSPGARPDQAACARMWIKPAIRSGAYSPRRLSRGLKKGEYAVKAPLVFAPQREYTCFAVSRSPWPPSPPPG